MKDCHYERGRVAANTIRQEKLIRGIEWKISKTIFAHDLKSISEEPRESMITVIETELMRRHKRNLIYRNNCHQASFGAQSTKTFYTNHQLEDILIEKKPHLQ